MSTEKKKPAQNPPNREDVHDFARKLRGIEQHLAAAAHEAPAIGLISHHGFREIHGNEAV